MEGMIALLNLVSMIPMMYEFTFHVSLLIVLMLFLLCFTSFICSHVIIIFSLPPYTAHPFLSPFLTPSRFPVCLSPALHPPSHSLRFFLLTLLAHPPPTLLLNPSLTLTQHDPAGITRSPRPATLPSLSSPNLPLSSP